MRRLGALALAAAACACLAAPASAAAQTATVGDISLAAARSMHAGLREAALRRIVHTQGDEVGGGGEAAAASASSSDPTVARSFAHPYYEVSMRLGHTHAQGWQDIRTTGTLSTVSEVDDLPFDGVDLPFDFPFYGHPHRRVFLNPNGFLSMLPATCADFTFCNWNPATRYVRYVAGLMTDLNPGRDSNSTVHYQALGGQDPRFIVQWTAVPLWIDAASDDERAERAPFAPPGGGAADPGLSFTLDAAAAAGDDADAAAHPPQPGGARGPPPSLEYTFQIILRPTGDIVLNYLRLPPLPLPLEWNQIQYPVSAGTEDAVVRGQGAAAAGGDGGSGSGGGGGGGGGEATTPTGLPTVISDIERYRRVEVPLDWLRADERGVSVQLRALPACHSFLTCDACLSRRLRTLQTPQSLACRWCTSAGVCMAGEGRELERPAMQQCLAGAESGLGAGGDLLDVDASAAAALAAAATSDPAAAAIVADVAATSAGAGIAVGAETALVRESCAAAATTAPLIDRQPSPATLSASAGSAVRLAVGARGTPPLSYQWTRDGEALGPPRSGDDGGAVLLLPAVEEADAGVYAVSVSNAHGRTRSVNVQLSVTPIGQGGSASADFECSFYCAAALAHCSPRNGLAVFPDSDTCLAGCALRHRPGATPPPPAHTSRLDIRDGARAGEEEEAAAAAAAAAAETERRLFAFACRLRHAMLADGAPERHCPLVGWGDGAAGASSPPAAADADDIDADAAALQRCDALAPIGEEAVPAGAVAPDALGDELLGVSGARARSTPAAAALAVAAALVAMALALAHA